MSAPPEHPPAGARRFPQPQGFSFWVVGNPRAVLRDAYHTFLQMRWSLSLALISLGLLLANVVFALAFHVTGGVAGTDGSYFDMFVFSMETMATIGYGVMNPVSSAAHIVMIVEAIFGIIVVALATGLVFTKFSRATARMAFSRYAVITVHDGKNTLMFRCGNRRSNVIVQAQLHVTCSMARPTAEGRPFYRIIDLPLVRDRMSGLRRGWTVMHVIDEASPLYGLEAAALEAADLEIEISLTGLDDIMMQTVHSSHLYTFSDVRFGHRLADTISPLANGDLVLDLTKFDVIEPDPHVSVAA
jgi:inward rectifier potassium channel